MATVRDIQLGIEHLDKDFTVTAMFFRQPEIKAVVVLPEQKVAVFTDIIQGVAAQLGPWQGEEIEPGCEIDKRNYYAISIGGE